MTAATEKAASHNAAFSIAWSRDYFWPVMGILSL